MELPRKGSCMKTHLILNLDALDNMSPGKLLEKHITCTSRNFLNCVHVEYLQLKKNVSLIASPSS